MRTGVPRMTLSYPYRDLCYRPHIGIILGWFPGRYTRPKTGIFSRSQYELSSLQNFVLRHIGRMALRLSRDCPISRLPLTFTHGEISQKIFRKFSQVAPHSPAEFAPSRRNPHNPAEPRKTSETPETPEMLHPAEIFPNFFSKIFPKFFQKNCTRGACVENTLNVTSREIFRKFFFPKFFGIFLTCMKPRQLDCEDFVTLRFHYD